jgi:hypothetical protein
MDHPHRLDRPAGLGVVLAADGEHERKAEDARDRNHQDVRVVAADRFRRQVLALGPAARLRRDDTAAGQMRARTALRVGTDLAPTAGTAAGPGAEADEAVYGRAST